MRARELPLQSLAGEHAVDAVRSPDVEVRERPPLVGNYLARKPIQRAALITLSFVMAGGLWIEFSDYLPQIWANDSRMLMFARTWKDWLFVTATGGVLFVLLAHLLRRDARLLHRYVRQRADLHELSQFRQNVIDNASIWINVLDPSSRVTLWNKAAEQISGYPREEVIGRDDIWKRLYPDPDYRENITAKIRRILEHGEEIADLETRIRCRDGQQKVIAWTSRRFTHGGLPAGSIAIGRDVTEHKQMQQLLRARDRQLSILMANVPGMVYRRRNNRACTLRFVSSGCLNLTGYTADDLIDDRGIAYASLVHPEDRERIQAKAHEAARELQSYALEYRIVHRDGEPRWVWEQGRLVHTEDGPHLEGIIVNITDRKHMEQQLEKLAVQDPLTGLHNRRELQAVLEEHVRRSCNDNEPLTLLWIDIDHFKAINDRHGHLAGDEVLRKVAGVIRDHLREEDSAARFGGDEFVVMLSAMQAAAAQRLAETLLQGMRAIRVMLPDGQELGITVSMGMATLPEHATDADTLFEAADRAMYLAKHDGRDRIQGADALGHMPVDGEARDEMQRRRN